MKTVKEEILENHLKDAFEILQEVQKYIVDNHKEENSSLLSKVVRFQSNVSPVIK